MRLTKNFDLSEFVVSAGIKIKPTDEQLFCLDKLCKNILQKIRDKFGLVKITSGLRNMESHNKLIRQGYKASRTSDHFAWSSANPIGTGAADFIVPGKNMLKVFHWIIDNLFDKCGQIIYHEDENFIHISNHLNEIFIKKEIRPETRTVMISKNGILQAYPRRPKSKQNKPICWRFLND